ncbi:MAG: hypothetical protein KHY67_04790 [Collinsella intestinalis]|uniref:Uncharacterized protein n=1 Tax=Collinsella intestinalis TaxID=147207 RepID=A0A943BP58_9ACTN|nr:hypothetical protein [Collinsella intestinalis]
MAKTRRVILFLVEGPSEETALVEPFKRYLRAAGDQSQNVRNETFHCDVTTARLFPDNADFRVKDNVVETVTGFIADRIASRQEYRWSDIAQVVHIVDLDGAFIPKERCLQGDTDEFYYGEDFISAKDPTEIVERNREKSASLKRLAYKGQLTYSCIKVPYKVYFLSRNLEHALYGLDVSCSDDDKRRLAIAYLNKVGDNPEGIKKTLFDEKVRVPGDYFESWKEVQQNCNSLKRGSNLHLLFDAMQ